MKPTETPRHWNGKGDRLLKALTVLALTLTALTIAAGLLLWAEAAS